MDHTSDMVSADRILSQGIGNSPAFQSIKHAELGERSGVLFVIYFDNDQGRKIYMRADALPDRLGEGEANFADTSGNPPEFLSLFVNAVQKEGKDVPDRRQKANLMLSDSLTSFVTRTAHSSGAFFRDSPNSP